MGDWPQGAGSRYQDDDAATYETAINPNATANTKGSYTTIFAATTFAATGLVVTIRTADASTDYLVDVALGAAASEQIIAANLLASSCTGLSTAHYILPLFIPSGSRISARSQAGGASKSLNVKMQLIGGAASSDVFSRIETWGAATADSGGTSVDPGGSINTKGAYSQLVAASAFDVKRIYVAIGNQQNATRTTMLEALDIAIGAALSEQVIIPNLEVLQDATQDMIFPQVYGPFDIMIPSGTRVAARAMSQNADATDRLFDVVVYGIG